jgi:hypothetical protein
MPRMEHGEYRALLDTVAKYAMVLDREPEKAKGFFTAGDMSAEEIDKLIESKHIEVTLDE